MDVSFDASSNRDQVMNNQRSPVEESMSRLSILGDQSYFLMKSLDLFTNSIRQGIIYN